MDISGVTFDGNGVYSEVGVLFLDATGSLVRSRVTNVVTSEDNAAFNFPGGYRSNNFGYGVAQTTAASSAPPGAQPRPLLIDNSRIDKYNKLGVLIDGATNDNPPLTPSGVVNAGTIRGSSIIGRTQCINFKANGNCAAVGLLTTGPTFGQDGLRVTAGSTATVSDSIMSQNLVNGSGAPTRSSNTVPNSTNNDNLPLGSGARFIGAGTSSISTSNIVDNAYGAQNLGLDGSTASTSPLLDADTNWWGLRYAADDRQRRAGDLADLEPAGAREPGERDAGAGLELRLEQRRCGPELQCSRLLPVPQRHAGRSQHGPVPDRKRASSGFGRRALCRPSDGRHDVRARRDGRL